MALLRISEAAEQAGLPRASPGRFGPDCGCDTDPLAPTAERSHSWSCSLGDQEAECRVGEWRATIGMSRQVEREAHRLRVVFDASAPVIAELVRLCAAETDCGQFFSFELAITAADLVLTVGGVPGSQGAVSRFLDLVAPGPSGGPGESEAVELGGHGIKDAGSGQPVCTRSSIGA